MIIVKNQKTGKYDLDFNCSGRRIRKRGFIRREDAVNYHAKMLNDKMYKKFHLPKEEKISFLDLAKKYLENHSKPNKKSFITDTYLLKPLIEFFGILFLEKDRELDTLELKALTHYSRELGSKLTLHLAS